MPVQTWSPDRYAKNARFVSDLGMPVVDLLAPRPGERILDIGCGDGVLTKKLADLGCQVMAIDSSPAQVEGARALGLDDRTGDFAVGKDFDAVWLRPAAGSTLAVNLKHACDTTDALARIFALATPADVAGVWIKGLSRQGPLSEAAR